MADIETEGQSPRASRRRRRRSHSNRTSQAGLRGYLRTQAFSRHLFVTMCVLGLVYAGTIAYRYYSAAVMYHMVVVGMSEREVKYMLGTPKKVTPDNVWKYDEDGRRLDVSFDGARRMQAVRCTAAEQADNGCGDIHGIRIGTTEDAIWLRLGKPDREVYQGTDKTIYYDGIGAVFHLRKFAVTDIELRHSATAGGLIVQALLGLIP